MRLRPAAPGTAVLVVRMVARHCPGLGAALGATALFAGLAPVLLTVSMALLLDAASRTARSGAGDARLWWCLGLTGAALVFSLALGPILEALGQAAAVRLRYAVQSRLMAAVHRPRGLEHLERPEVHTAVEAARGALISFAPAEAPLVLARTSAARLGGVFACVVVGTFRWWLALLLAAAWTGVRVPLRRSVLTQTTAMQDEARTVRRSKYFLRLATDGKAAHEVRVFGLGPWLLENFRRTWWAGMVPVWRVRARFDRVVVAAGVLLLCCYLGAGWLLAQAAYRHQVSLAQIGALLPALLMTSVIGGISFDDMALQWMGDGLAQLRRLEHRLGSAAEPQPAGSRPAAGPPRQEIGFHGVRFRYPVGDREVLAGVDLVVEAGRSTAIVGVNGAGKTTLVKLLAGLYRPTEGTVTVDGQDLASLDARAWQRCVALINQDVVRFPLSLEENIALGAPRAPVDHARLREALRLSGGEALPDSLPAGWATRLSPHYPGGTGLSAGQWQRVALARALYAVRHHAGVLVLDEPTSALDVRGEADFHRRFLDITRGVTTVIISHRFSSVRQADTICVLEGGRVVERGSHEELLQCDGRYARMFRLQAERFAEEPRS
ncbi:ABC transporter ATP-binding protein [Streptomyces sp. NPDC059629]|uniref:ABC transporter ATP-binding protein n=1 Tax=Streptomyces sp. NPDC059629 TaxID=3346889 RepID=UPI00368AC976